MKIAILSPAFPLRGGIAFHSANLYQHLKTRNHQITLFSFKKQFPSFLFPGKTQLDHSLTAYRPPSEPVFIPYQPLTWLKTAKKICSGDFDLLLLVYWTPFTAPGYAAIIRYLKKRRPLPILYLLHNIVPHEALPGVKLFSRSALGLADGFILQSSKVENELLSCYPQSKDKWRKLVYHPLYKFEIQDNFTAQVARKLLGIRESRVLLYFGLVRKYKGLRTLIEAFPAVLEHFKGDIRLLIAGEFYHSPESYFDLIAKLEIESQVTVHNRFIPDEEVSAFFLSADVVVLPYISASQSGVIATAFGFGKPVITTDVGGLTEVIRPGQNGLLCPPQNPEALAKTIIEFYGLSNTVNWKQNIEEGNIKYSWDYLVQAIEEFAFQSKISEEKR